MEKIGRYRLTRRLGAGSFATVWKGRDDDLDVDVAVKILADNWADNEDVRGRFLTEARLMRKIRDERIVRVYDIGTLDDGRPYFVMDYADSGSLDDLRKQGIPPRRALRLCAEAARALGVLHKNDVIHRDVTPGNILLGHDNAGELTVLIADLGVAKSMVGAVGATMTAGTPAYMALEQANGVGVLDHRADLYSIAAVTYAMLTGRPPFPVRTLSDLLTRDPNMEPAPIAAQVGAPPMLDGLMLSSLAPQPGRRPPSAEVFANALDQIANQMPGDDRPLPPEPAGDMTTLRPNPGGSPVSYPGMPGTPASLVSGGNQGSGVGPGPHPGQGSFVGPHGQQGNFGQQGSFVQPGSMVGPQQGSMVGPLAGQKSGRGAPFYVLLGVGALALFAVSLLITVAALSS
ncbi:MAG: protein kinase domain-containing protein [Propionibacteriaceae bacterium]